MTSVLQFRRGNTAQNNSFTGAVAEISVDTSTNTLRVHDAITAGGAFIYPTLRLTNAQRLATTPQVGQVVFVTDYVSAGVSPTWIGDGATAGGVLAAGSTIAGATSSTNIAGGAAGSLPYQSAPSTTVFLGIGTNGYVLTSDGSAPAWSPVSGLSAGLATTATNIAGGSAGQVPYQTSGGVTAFINTATTGNFLQANYVGAPTWTTTANIYVANASISTNVRSGTAGQLVYQSAANTSGFVGPGTYGQFLMSTGANAPTYQSTITQSNGSIYISGGIAATSTTTGALVVAGGVGITGNVNVGGNVNIAGTITFGGTGTTVQTDNITVVDPVVLVASGNTGNSVDFSFAGKYVSSGTKYAAFVRSAGTGIWNLVSGLTSAPSEIGRAHV